MTDPAERLDLLEQQVLRAIELIEKLRAENRRLVEERDALRRRAETLAAELAAPRGREQALARMEAEHRRLLEERHQLLGQVESVLKELSRIEGL
jgi:hypothetical protein